MVKKALVNHKDIQKYGFAGTPFDPKHPASFHKLFPKEVLLAMSEIREDMFSKDENELEIYCNPTPEMNRVRHSFWREYDIAQTLPVPEIDFYQVCKSSGITYMKLLKILTTPEKLLWVLCPIVRYQDMIEEALERGLKKIRDIIEAPLFGPLGELNTAAAKEVMSAVKYLDQRRYGAFTQNINLRAENTNKNYEINTRNLRPKSVEDIDREINAIEQRLQITEKQELVEEDAGSEDIDVELEARERGLEIKVKKT